ncbi:MAG: hypothetical protein IPI63_12330 [Methanothrix sp.]|jgi:hypothetical protein|uniref:hypothetical protein n=1 Tax=Methanothrix sp. TaxID=90426 RepID=UPI001BD6D266|nr:hypothetical protein [Methanothrix sp.]MBK7387443.1 hypothetical protein [Methanothrix sp.]HPW72370.1 hypothetical protein [Methanothrix sp.]
MAVENLNLDRVAAERAQAMVRKAKNGVDKVEKPVDTLERLTTKALGVLQEQGIYAMMLFLFSRTSDEYNIAPLIRPQLYEALKELPGFETASIEDKSDKALEYFTRNILNNIDTLLLVRDLYEQTLIYARYAAKAEGNKETGG